MASTTSLETEWASPFPVSGTLRVVVSSFASSTATPMMWNRSTTTAARIAMEVNLDVVDGAVPAEQLEEPLESIRRDPPHPGVHVAGVCERLAVTVDQAARKFGTSPASLSLVIQGRAPVSPDLAVRMEAAGWPSAEFWMRLQSRYDLAQARQRMAA